jgi:hypothetical protein
MPPRVTCPQGNGPTHLAMAQPQSVISKLKHYPVRYEPDEIKVGMTVQVKHLEAIKP